MNVSDPQLSSWVDVPAHSDFPIQNLPFGIFRTQYLSPVAGVAIGDHVLDLVYLHEHGYLDGLGLPAGIFNQPFLNSFIALGRKHCGKVRERIADLLNKENDELQEDRPAREIALIPMTEVQMQMPVDVRNYTDFYSSEEHATNVGSMFRDPKNALLPNWKHLPVGYHGRASSIVVSGTPIVRPKGQLKGAEEESPRFESSQKLDFELELAFITCRDTSLGSPVNIHHCADHIFGFVLFNDWSARDIQQWEYVPLGPFLGKNFASTISPWIVTTDALEAFRAQGPGQQPVLPYLRIEGDRNFDINLEVLIESDSCEPTTVTRTNARYLYWNTDQQLAHQTSNGCNVLVGDVYASGTISGPTPGSYGSLLELSWNGQRPLKMPDGTERTFLQDGDTVIMKGHAQRNGCRIGFGSCTGKILKSR
jgi:fumarylacetoacetase